MTLHSLLRSYRNGYYALCRHHSHRLRLLCYRSVSWDGYCGKHASQHLRDECPR